MLKILNTRQIKDLDACTIQREPIVSIDLMERACRAFVNWFTQRFKVPARVGIVTGTGNNGGDGLGIARMLSALNFGVKVWLIRGDAKPSVDFETNRKRLPGTVEVHEFVEPLPEDPWHDTDVVIDAIFGSGLSRPVEGIYANVIRLMNKAKAIRIAVDVPSGLNIDAPSSGEIVEAVHTVTFQLPKLAFMFPGNDRFVGDWHLVDIGLHQGCLADAETDKYFITEETVRAMLPERKKFSHKGDYGRALLIAGSLGKIGAAVLAARAIMRSGAGLLTTHVPACGYRIIQAAVPESMASVDAGESFFSTPPDFAPYDIIGIGPGLGTQPETGRAFAATLESGKPMIIDADALNILSKNQGLLSRLPPDSILTPHPKEFQRLAGDWQNDNHRLDLQIEFARKTRSVIVLKGAHTSIATPEGTVYFNSSGNPGLATGGSGDVLTGVLTGLRAQGYGATETAIIGVFLHGLAGDLAVRKVGVSSLIASDIVEFLPAAFDMHPHP